MSERLDLGTHFPLIIFSRDGKEVLNCPYEIYPNDGVSAEQFEGNPKVALV